MSLSGYGYGYGFNGNPTGNIPNATTAFTALPPGLGIGCCSGFLGWPFAHPFRHPSHGGLCLVVNAGNNVLSLSD